MRGFYLNCIAILEHKSRNNHIYFKAHPDIILKWKDFLSSFQQQIDDMWLLKAVFVYMAFNFIDISAIICRMLFSFIRFDGCWSLGSLSCNGNKNLSCFCNTVLSIVFINLWAQTKVCWIMMISESASMKLIVLLIKIGFIRLFNVVCLLQNFFRISRYFYHQSSSDLHIICILFEADLLVFAQ